MNLEIHTTHSKSANIFFIQKKYGIKLKLKIKTNLKTNNINGINTLI
jgi:hypothetical protein